MSCNFVTPWVGAVTECLDIFECHQTSTDHGVNDRQETLDFVGAVDNLDDEGQVFGDIEKIGAMHKRGMAVAERAAQDGDAGHAMRECSIDDGLYKGWLACCSRSPR